MPVIKVTPNACANSKSFQELFDKHIKWITGQVDGLGYDFGYKTRTLDKINGGFDFVKLLISTSINLKMITIGSQPSSYTKENDDLTIGNSDFPLLARPYICGVVNIDMFYKILKQVQNDLIIFGVMPFLSDKNIRFTKKNLQKYNIVQPDPKCRVYIKNSNLYVDEYKDYDWLALTKYDYKGYDTDKAISDDGKVIGSDMYNRESPIYEQSMDRLALCTDTWEDHELCEIYIIHPEFDIDPNIFEKCVMDLCRKVNNKFD